MQKKYFLQKNFYERWLAKNFVWVLLRDIFLEILETMHLYFNVLSNFADGFKLISQSKN